MVAICVEPSLEMGLQLIHLLRSMMEIKYNPTGRW
jgi:hypothetical protein